MTQDFTEKSVLPTISWALPLVAITVATTCAYFKKPDRNSPPAAVYGEGNTATSVTYGLTKPEDIGLVCTEIHRFELLTWHEMARHGNTRQHGGIKLLGK